MLDQLRSGARHNHSRTFGSSLNSGNDNAYTFSDGKRFQTRLFLSRHTGFRLAQVENHIRSLNSLYRSVDDLADPSDVFVVNGVALCLANLLKNNLLGQLRRDSSQDAFSHLRDLQLAADFNAGINFARVFQSHLKLRIFYLLGVFHHCLNRERTYLAGFLVQLRPQVFLGLVVLTRGDHNCVFHCTHHNLGINALFPAERVDGVIKLACHSNIPYSTWVCNLTTRRVDSRSPAPNLPSPRSPAQFPASAERHLAAEVSFAPHSCRA